MTSIPPFFNYMQIAGLCQAFNDILDGMTSKGTPVPVWNICLVENLIGTYDWGNSCFWILSYLNHVCIASDKIEDFLPLIWNKYRVLWIIIIIICTFPLLLK